MPKIETEATNRIASLEIPRAALELFKFTRECSFSKVAQAKHGKALDYILLEPEKWTAPKSTVVHAIATDGHRMAHYWWPLRATDVFQAPCFIQGVAIKILFSTLGVAKHRQCSYRLELDNGVFYVETVDANGEAVEVWHTSEEIQYPEWRKTIPERLEEQATSKNKNQFNMDVRFLEDFLSYLKELELGGEIEEASGAKIRSLTMKKECKGDTEPVIITADWYMSEGEFEYIAMPRHW